MGLMSIRMNKNRWAPVRCPNCDASFMFYGNYAARIDHHGFERYDLECPACDEVVAGVIDPYDDAFLVSSSSV